MNNEFKKTANKNQTVYTLENASAGGTSAGSIASVSSPMGGVQKRGQIVTSSTEKKVPATTPRNFVAKNAKTGGAGAHKDKKKAEKQGTAKHKKPYMEALQAQLDQLKSNVAEAIPSGNEYEQRQKLIKYIARQKDWDASDLEHSTTPELIQLYKECQADRKDWNNRRSDWWSRADAHAKEKGISKLDALGQTPHNLDRDTAQGQLKFKEQGVAENYPKHQDLSGISTDKLKAYLAKQGQQQSSGEGNQVKRVRAELQRREQGVAEGVATTMSMPDAVKLLRQYGADHFKTTSNELHFYKNGRHLSVDLVMNPDTTRSVSLSSLNAATRGLKGQGVAEGSDQPSKKDAVIMSYLDTVSNSPTGTPDGDFLTDWQYTLEEEFGIEMDTAVLANLLPQLDSQVEMLMNKYTKTMNNRGMYESEQGVAEGFNGEYDDEAGMAESNLHTMARAVKGLMDTIDSNDNLPEWCQEKIAKAEMMVTGVWDYLLSQKEQGIDPAQGVAEGAKVDRQAKHITASMMKKGKSKKDAESIAWAHIKHPKNESVDPYFESLNQMVERQLEPTMDLDAWNDNFQNADPQKYHQFKNKSPEKKK